MARATRRSIYLDYAATTPMDSRVLEAMKPYFGAKFGNPSSLHSFGQEAIKAVDEAREKVSKAIGADFHEIIFTGSATEANNLALRGVLKSWEVVSRNRGSFHSSGEMPAASRSAGPAGTKPSGAPKASSKQRSQDIFQPRIIVSAIEHESVLETCRDLSSGGGVEVIYLPVNKEGLVDLNKLNESLNERTVLVSIMYANNEIGTIQPIAEILEIIRNFRGVSSAKNQVSGNLGYPLFHTDAAQALQFLDCSVDSLGVDLMTFSAHKIYGPKGVGALFVKDLGFRMQNLGGDVGKSSRHPESCILNPVIIGGGQEFGLRSGTENVPNIAGFAEAVELISNSRELENKRIGKLRKYLWEGIAGICRKAEVNGGSQIANGKARIADSKGQRVGDSLFTPSHLPNILNVYFPDFLAEELLTALDLQGVAVSAGSACSARSAEPSYVIQALGYNKERARRSLRFSLGRPTMKAEIDRVLKILKNVIGRRSENRK